MADQKVPDQKVPDQKPADQKPADQKPDASQPANVTPGAYEDVQFLRLPLCSVMLSKDQHNNGRTFEGTVGFKYGSEKTDWLRISYIDMKKIIDFCREHRDMFNSQLKLEREKITGDL